MRQHSSGVECFGGELAGGGGRCFFFLFFGFDFFFFWCLDLVIASGKSLKVLLKALQSLLLPFWARWGTFLTPLHTLAACLPVIVCKRLAHTNPPCCSARSQLGRAEFTETHKPLASLLTLTYREEESDCPEKKLHPKVRCTVQDGEKRSLDLLRYFLLQAYKRVGLRFYTALELLYQSTVRAEQEPAYSRPALLHLEENSTCNVCNCYKIFSQIPAQWGALSPCSKEIVPHGLCGFSPH